MLVALANTAGNAPLGSIPDLVVAGLGFLILGWYDDRQHAPPGARLVVASGLFGAVILLQPDLLLTSIDLGLAASAIPLWVLSFPFTILCLVGLQNSINMVDGMNGLLICLAMFWVGCLLMYAPDHLVIYLQLLVLGLAILLPYNLFGALFLGDAGSYSIGATVGLLMIYCPQPGRRCAAHAHGGAWLMVPVVDCLRVMVSRIWHERSPLRSGQEPSAPPAGPSLALADLPADLSRAGGRAGRGGRPVARITLSMLALSATSYLGLLWVTRRPARRAPRAAPS